MQAIFSGNLSILVVLIFPVLLIAGFLIQRITSSVRQETTMNKYKLERGPIIEAPKPPAEEDLVPGYTLVTHEDYDELVEKIKAEIASNGESTAESKEEIEK